MGDLIVQVYVKSVNLLYADNKKLSHKWLKVYLYRLITPSDITKSSQADTD